MKLVVVKWIDAECQESRWNDLDDVKEELSDDLAFCVTAGFILKETSQFLAVTLTDGVDCCGPYVQIPKVCIVDRTEWEFEWGTHGKKKQSS